LPGRWSGADLGLVESIAAGYLDPYVGGGTKDFAPYVLMIVALMFRPYACSARTGSSGCNGAMLHRESGVFKTSYAADMALYPLPIARWTVAAIVVLFAAVLPLSMHEYYLSIVNLSLIAIVGALASTSWWATRARSPWARGLHVRGGLHRCQPGREVRPAVLGDAAGRRTDGGPDRRHRRHAEPAHQGLYLAIATLAGQLIIEWVINHTPAISGGAQASIQVPRPELWGYQMKTQGQLYFFLLFFAALAILATLNLVRSRIGRAFVAIRDQDIAAEIIGIDIYRYKLLSFAISSFYAGVCGVLYTYYLGIANYEQFQIGVSIDFLAMIIIGGLGSVLGSILGAVFVDHAADRTPPPHGTARRPVFNAGETSSVVAARAGAVRRPHHLLPGGGAGGLNRLWRNIRNYFRVWPFSY